MLVPGSTTPRETVPESSQSPEAPPLSTVHVVSHTHWDREWYHTAPRFRQRLVALIDALLVLPATEERPFLLDGQAIVLEDYLTVRPERFMELSRRLQSGALEAGPWYVLADNLIPSGEAVVRNLMAGRRALRRMGAVSPAVLYCPDTFGHPAALPLVAKGFGFELGIVWRGYGGSTAAKKDVFRWIAASGEELVTYHLPPDGYEIGSSMPSSLAAMETFWNSRSTTLQARAMLGIALLPNGADHHALQPDIDAALQLLREVAAPVRVVRSSLRNFAQAIVGAARAFERKPAHERIGETGNAHRDAHEVEGHLTRVDASDGDEQVDERNDNQLACTKALSSQRVVADDRREDIPSVRGELRDSYGYTWTLGGSLGTRAHQKRSNARAERALLRDVEPWLVLAWLHGGSNAVTVAHDGNITLVQAPALLDSAWRTLLRTHPHDTLCGCSVDAVARAMDERMAETMSQATGLREAALALALRHDAVAARASALQEVGTLVVRNRSARSRGGVAQVVLDETLDDVPVGPASARDRLQRSERRDIPHVHGLLMQPGRVREVFRRRESPQHYPDNDLVRAHFALVWVAPLPALGLALFQLDTPGLGEDHGQDGGAGAALAANENRAGRAATAPMRIVSVSHADDVITMSNGLIDVSVSNRGLTMRCNGVTVENALQLVTQCDIGDTYTPAMRGREEQLSMVSCKVLARGPLRAKVAVSWKTLVPPDDPGIGDHRSSNSVGAHRRIAATTTLILDAEARTVRVDITGNNRRRNQRLRLHFATGVIGEKRPARVFCDAAFSTVQRVPLNIPDDLQTAERVVRSMPLHRWVCVSNGVRGATLHSDGLAEVEALADGTLAITLVRSIGQLSKGNLPERPGHAGWPVPTPLAQSLGKFRARAGLHFHDSWCEAVQAEIEEASDDLLLPLTGETLRDFSAASQASTVVASSGDGRNETYNVELSRLSGPTLEGSGLRMSTVTLADDGDGIVLRCINDAGEPRDGAWILPYETSWQVARARLDETLLEPWRTSSSRVEISVDAFGVETVRVRRAL